MFARRAAVALVLAVAGVSGAHVVVGLAAMAIIVALLNAYPRKAVR